LTRALGRRKKKKCFVEFPEAQQFLPRPRPSDKLAGMHNVTENVKLH
jgi:hypothetical protein